MDTSEHAYTSFSSRDFYLRHALFILVVYELVWTEILLLQRDDTLHLARCVDVMALGNG